MPSTIDQTFMRYLQSWLGGGDIHTDPRIVSDLDDIARGLVTGKSVMLKFGATGTDIGNGDDEDVWDLNGTIPDWTPPTQARIHDLYSSSASDTGGTGAGTVTVYGLGTAYALQSEVVVMDGTALVPTANEYVSIHRMTNDCAADNVGTVFAQAQTDATNTAAILPAKNQTGMAIFQVPADTQAVIKRYYVSVKRGTTVGAADVFLKVQPFGGAFQIKNERSIMLAGDSAIDHDFPIPLVVPAKSTIKVVGQPTASMSFAAGFDMVLEPDS